MWRRGRRVGGGGRAEVMLENVHGDELAVFDGEEEGDEMEVAGEGDRTPGNEDVVFIKDG